MYYLQPKDNEYVSNGLFLTCLSSRIIKDKFESNSPTTEQYYTLKIIL